MKNQLNFGIIAAMGVMLGFSVLYLTQGSELPFPPRSQPSPSPTLEQLAEDGWMKGCIPHTVDEAQKATDVVIDRDVASARAKNFCKCDWDYMINDMGLSLEDIATIGEPNSRGSSAIVEAQNICYERNKGGYSQ